MIDELGAIAKVCGVSAVGVREEREQTLNQLLAEMDGFDPRKGIVVMSARTECLIPLYCARARSIDAWWWIDVSSLKDAQAPPIAHILYPGQKEVAPTDLQFREFARYLDRALRAKGFAPAPENARPDLLILLSYGIGEPQTTVLLLPDLRPRGRRHEYCDGFDVRVGRE